MPLVGCFRGTAGRGEGSGEYPNLSGIARHADGLTTWDSNQFRVTLLDTSGGVRRRDESQTARSGKNRDRWSPRKQRAARNLADGISGNGYVGPMEIRQPVTYEIARLSDGQVVPEDTLFR